VVHGMDGIDEISLAGPTAIWEVTGDNTTTYTVTPEEYGLSRGDLSHIKGGTPEENAYLMVRILQGEEGHLLNAVALNAGAAIFVAGLAPDIHVGVSLALEILRGGVGLHTLERLSTLSQDLD